MNWIVRIEHARQSGGFKPEDRRDAARWVTCACGEQDPRIPRTERLQEPVDETLRFFGREFFVAVKENRFHQAEQILLQIEKRAAEILAGNP